jgi:BCD family chlorophyll transporter-like MFS transporter
MEPDSPSPAQSPAEPAAPRPSFVKVIAEIREDPVARRFTLFVFVSMLAYSAQELILEPFAGLVFKMTPGAVGAAVRAPERRGAARHDPGGRARRPVRRPSVPVDAALDHRGVRRVRAALAGLAAASLVGPTWPIAPTAFVLGLANGVFAVSAIGSMMGLAGAGQESREGVRMGVWGAAQAGAFAIGGFLGAEGVGALRDLFHQPAPAFCWCLHRGVGVPAWRRCWPAGSIVPPPGRRPTEAGATPVEFGGAHG